MMVSRAAAASRSDGGGRKTKPPSLLPYYLMMVPPSVILAEEKETRYDDDGDDEIEDYYHFYRFSGLIDNKKLLLAAERVKKVDLKLPWQREVYSIPDDSVCVGSSHGWLAYIDPRNLAFYLFNPFLIHDQNPQNPNPLSSFIPLPPLDSLPYYLRVATHRSPSSSDVVTRFIRRKWSFIGRNWDNDWEPESYDPQGLSGNIRFRMRFACSSSPSSMNIDDCYVMILLGSHPRLAFCKLCCHGINDNVWTELETPHDYQDVMYSNKDQVFLRPYSDPTYSHRSLGFQRFSS